MTTTIVQSLILETTSCIACGMVFAVPQDWLAARRKDGQGFHCPGGHSLVFTVTENDKLRRQVKQLEASRQAARDQAEAAERSNAALRGVITKTKKRVANGACPCCRRHFANLQGHMATKHPDYAAGEA